MKNQNQEIGKEIELEIGMKMEEIRTKNCRITRRPNRLRAAVTPFALVGHLFGSIQRSRQPCSLLSAALYGLK